MSNTPDKHTRINDLVAIIKGLSVVHHVKIGAILKNRNVTLNESGIQLLVNVSLLDDDTLDEITKYIDFATKREQMLTVRDEIAETMKLLLTPEVN